MTEDKIDIVVLWVDGSDPEFIREKQAVTGQVADLDQEIDGEQRYRDYGIFNYWFRMRKSCSLGKSCLLSHQWPKTGMVELGASKTQVGHS